MTITESFVLQWRDSHGIWQYPGCTEAEATFGSREELMAAVESLIDGGDYEGAKWRLVYDGPDGKATEIVA